MRMRRATPQRTPRGPWLEPTPMIALEMTCVVETGMPKCGRREEDRSPRSSRPRSRGPARAWRRAGPSSCMIRQPPTAVPSDSAVADTTMTQIGTVDVSG